jgi:hypothetical protein
MRRAVGIPVLKFKQRDLRHFRNKLRDTRGVQEKRLTDILQMLQGSSFAKDHGLKGVRSIEDLKKALPVAPYERMAPYIERLKVGEKNALFSQETRLIMFAMTSGTTRAPKYIPVTQASLSEYRKSWAIWGCALAEEHPLVPFGGVINLATGFRSSVTTGGIPCGSISGLIVSVMHSSLRLTNCLPPSVNDVPDFGLRQYLALRLSLPRRDTMMVTTANPSTLISFARRLDQEKEHLIRDLRDGTLTHRSAYPKSIWQKIKARITERLPERARELELVLARSPLYPREAWPMLSVVGVWTGGTLQPYLGDLPRYYGGVALRDHGLSASEGRMTIPLSGGFSPGALCVDGPFFEFVPESEMGKECPDTLLAHELEVGMRYGLVVTTSGGLVRYDMQDIVECQGFEGNAPLLRFLHKGSQIANVTGEKISAWQVTEAVRLASEITGIRLSEYTIAPTYGDPSHYLLMVERNHENQVLDLNPLAYEIDRILGSLNVEYREKRASGRLGGLRSIFIPQGAFAEWMSSMALLHGTPPEQYKHPFLITDYDFAAQYAYPNAV